ncbi:transglycosylase domain-containing protein [Propionibacteriaceae bacterium Y2011]|uniref:transglycosylase domain-containing protein n=1 Tax=Microlunatus sp. Y2014 TaxID=3418488 RepID=UPI003B4DA891
MPVTPKRVGGVLYSAVMFVVVSVLSGLLIAGLAVPFAGLAGVTSKAAVDELQKLPVEFETPPQAERSTVLLGDGSVLTNFYDENRVYVPLDKVAPVMQQAQIAIEDHRFYEHGAMDPKATLRALVRNTTGGSTQGGSSLTQQYVKMVQIERAALNNDPKGVLEAQETTYARKIQELRYAIALEKKFSQPPYRGKDEILERYLNIAYYGNGAYGVEAAAHFYFNTTAEKLTLPQAAMLAGLVQNPDAVNPISAKRLAMERRDVVINRMAELRLISSAEAEEAKKTDFDAKKVQRLKNGCESSQYPFLCDYVRHTLLQTPSLGETPDERRALLYRGGLVIKTKIDRKTQDAAQAAISDLVGPTDPLISVANIIEPGTGLILAMAQNRHTMGNDSKAGETYYNYSVTPQFGGAEGYQAGSTFKAFTLAAALDNGVQMDRKFKSPKSMDFSGYSWQSCTGNFTLTEEWKVSNSTRSNASGMSMAQATAYSVNTYFVQLEHRAGLCNTVRMAEAAGIDLSTPGATFEDMSKLPSFTLGPVEIAPLSLAEAYATFAARGKHCEPHIVESVTTKEGKAFDVPDGNCKQVMRPEVADGVTKMLEGVMDATGSRAAISGFPDQAGKTGTTEEGAAVWFAGYTPEVAGIAMIAADKTSGIFGPGKRRGIKGLRLENGSYLEATGGGDAGMGIYKPAMTAALRGRPKTKFVEPPKVITPPRMVEVPSIRGLSVSEIRTKLAQAGFVTVSVSRVHRSGKGTFLGLNPVPGTKREEGSTIQLVFSAGPPPPPPPPKPKPKPKPTPPKTEEPEPPKKTEPPAPPKKTEEPKKPGAKPSGGG